MKEYDAKNNGNIRYDTFSFIDERGIVSLWFNKRQKDMDGED